MTTKLTINRVLSLIPNAPNTITIDALVLRTGTHRGTVRARLNELLKSEEIVEFNSGTIIPRSYQKNKLFGDSQ